jgi:hypothetical protein
MISYQVHQEKILPLLLIMIEILYSVHQEVVHPHIIKILTNLQKQENGKIDQYMKASILNPIKT